MLDKVKVITAAASIPVTLAEARAHLRIDDTSEDTLITTLISVATEYAEKRLARALITQTWELYLDEFPADEIIGIKFPPLQSITSVKYYDSDNTLQTLATTVYDVDTIREPGQIRLADAQYWPATYYRPNAVIIRFVAGYGNASTNVPELIRAAIKLLISYFFENREAVQTMGSVAEIPIPKAIENIFNQFTVRERV